ncbi:MAG TPA: DNA polymerase III subunit delta [Candidatus Limnocylindrales bacterium]|nr:DNA polymerase III subunit delta [Candidatus Limnocylindrales bacterium]
MSDQAMSVPYLGYFWGEDAYGVDHAAVLFAAEHAAAAGGQPLDVWRTSVDGDADEGETGGGSSAKRRARVFEQMEERLATSPMFSGGTMCVVRQPAALLRESSSRERLIGLLDGVAPGNVLVFVDLIASGAKGPAQQGALRDAISQRKGRVAEFPALSRERMEGWLVQRARELNVSFAQGAAHMLAERVGAYVREGDVDRRRQSELANAELEKLALYRPTTPITTQDVEEMVSEAVPGSTWAFLDAVGTRRPGEAATLVERLLGDQAPLPVLITQIHRRIRELVVVREHLDAATRPQDLVRELKVQPFRAQKLAEQARAWQADELDDALIQLYELDLLSKGIANDGSPRSLSEDRSELGLLVWLAEHVGRAGGTARPTATVR